MPRDMRTDPVESVAQADVLPTERCLIVPLPTTVSLEIESRGYEEIDMYEEYEEIDMYEEYEEIESRGYEEIESRGYEEIESRGYEEIESKGYEEIESRETRANFTTTDRYHR